VGHIKTEIDGSALGDVAVSKWDGTAFAQSISGVPKNDVRREAVEHIVM
jgi:hypothetical protein